MTKRIHYHNLNVKGIFRLGKYNKLSAGAEFIKELLSSETDNITGKSMYTTALYAQDEINTMSISKRTRVCAIFTMRILRVMRLLTWLCCIR